MYVLVHHNLALNSIGSIFVGCTVLNFLHKVHTCLCLFGSASREVVVASNEFYGPSTCSSLFSDDVNDDDEHKHKVLISPLFIC